MNANFYPTKKQLVGLIFFMLLTAVVVLVVWYFFVQLPKEKAADQASQVLQTIGSEFVAMDGTKTTFEDAAGKVRVVSLWASWVPTAAEQLATLETVATKNPDIAVLAINRDEPLERANAYIRSKAIQLQNLVVTIDTVDSLYDSIGGYAMPETVIYNQRGELVWRKRGLFSVGDIETVLASIR